MKVHPAIWGVLAALALAAAAGAGALATRYFLLPPVCDLSEIEYPHKVGESDGMPVVRVFFVTSRRREPPDGTTFLNERGPGLTYGTADIRIPSAMRIGDMQVPDIPRETLNNRLATVMKVEVLPEEQFYERLAAWFDRVNAPAANLLVHGINHSFDSSLRQGGAMSFNLDMPQPVVVFAWPTSPGILPAIYHRDELEIEPAAAGLDAFLEGFQEKVHPRQINILAHSLGCKVVCDAFDRLATRGKWNDQETEISNVIFAAPDVDRDDFGKHFIREVANLARRVSVYVASNDGILVLSSILSGTPRAGVRDDAANLVDMMAADAADLPHVEIIDASFVNSSATSHSYYYQSRPVFSDIYNLLRNNLSARDRHLLDHEKAGSSNYWIIPP